MKCPPTGILGCPLSWVRRLDGLDIGDWPRPTSRNIGALHGPGTATTPRLTLSGRGRQDWQSPRQGCGSPQSESTPATAGQQESVCTALACAQAVLSHPDRTARPIMWTPDDAKLRSSMTLFALAAADSVPVFQEVLDIFFAGERDPRTVHLVGA
jgi:hypothetical protein